LNGGRGGKGPVCCGPSPSSGGKKKPGVIASRGGGGTGGRVDAPQGAPGGEKKQGGRGGVFFFSFFFFWGRGRAGEGEGVEAKYRALGPRSTRGEKNTLGVRAGAEALDVARKTKWFYGD